MLKYLFVIFILWVIIVFEVGIWLMETTPLSCLKININSTSWTDTIKCLEGEIIPH